MDVEKNLGRIVKQASEIIGVESSDSIVCRCIEKSGDEYMLKNYDLKIYDADKTDIDYRRDQEQNSNRKFYSPPEYISQSKGELQRIYIGAEVRERLNVELYSAIHVRRSVLNSLMKDLFSSGVLLSLSLLVAKELISLQSAADRDGFLTVTLILGAICFSLVVTIFRIRSSVR